MSGGESEVAGSVGSTGAVDRVEEDFTRDDEARSTGFIGKNSEITWLQRLKREVKMGPSNGETDEEDFIDNSESASPMFSQRKNSATPLPDLDQSFTVSAMNYNLDDSRVPVPDTVDPFEIPNRDIADNLFNTYLNIVHPSFPIIGKVNFIRQYRVFINSPHMKPGKKWLAILNMIFAIAAKYSHFIQADLKGTDKDHSIYLARARLLALNSESIFEHPDLQQVQVIGLVAFYLLAVSQINRCVRTLSLRGCTNNLGHGPSAEWPFVLALALASICEMIALRPQMHQRRFAIESGGHCIRWSIC